MKLIAEQCFAADGGFNIFMAESHGSGVKLKYLTNASMRSSLNSKMHR